VRQKNGVSRSLALGFGNVGAACTPPSASAAASQCARTRLALGGVSSDTAIQVFSASDQMVRKDVIKGCSQDVLLTASGRLPLLNYCLLFALIFMKLQ